MDLKTDLRKYIALLVQWSWLLLLSAVVFGAGAYYLSLRQQPIYQASTTILIDQAPGNVAQGNEYTSLLVSERRAKTYAELLTKRPLLETVAGKLGLPVESLGGVNVQPVRDTQLIEVRVTDTDPERAARMANILVATFAEQTQQLETARYAESKTTLQEQMSVLEQQIQQTEDSIAALGTTADDAAKRDRLDIVLAQLRQSYANLLQSYEQVRLAEAGSASGIAIVEPAVAPSAPISPRVLRNTTLAVIIGLMLAAGLVFLKEILDDSVRDPNLLVEQLGLPILGAIARAPESDNGKPIVVAQPRSPVAEAYRALRTNIDFASVDRPLRSLLVTSSAPAEGKTVVSLNLGAIMAQAGREVAVVDADLRRPMLHRRLELSNRDGLSELFVKPQVHLNGSLRKTSVEGVSVVTAGSIPPNPAELLGSEKMAAILQQVTERADLVVLDTPPVNAVTDAVVLAPRVDGVILVVRVGKTKLGAAKQAAEQLQRAGARILGIVLNDVPTGRSRYGYAYHGYYRYQYDAHGKTRRFKLFGRRKQQDKVEV